MSQMKIGGAGKQKRAKKLNKFETSKESAQPDGENEGIGGHSGQLWVRL